jgi:hypothetical protein
LIRKHKTKPPTPFPATPDNIGVLHISTGAIAEWATGSLLTTGRSRMLAAEGEIRPAGPNLLPMRGGI